MIESKTIITFEEEDAIEQAEIKKEVRNYIKLTEFVNKTVEIIKNKQDLYGPVEDYSLDMMILKAYTTTAGLYNNIESLNTEQLTKYITEISAYMLIILEKISPLQNENNNTQVNNKYVSLIEKTYVNKHIQYNSKYKTEESLTKQDISALMLMKAIRMKNLVSKINRNDKVIEALKDNAIDTLVFAYVMYSKVF